MLCIPNYKTARDVLSHLDTGGRWWDLSSQANDGIVSARELSSAAGEHAAYIDCFVQHVIWDFSPEDIETIRHAVPPALMDTVQLKRLAHKEPWRTNAAVANYVQPVTTVGLLQPHQDHQLESTTVLGAHDLKKPMAVKVPGSLAQMLDTNLTEIQLTSTTIGEAFWLFRCLAPGHSSTDDAHVPLALISRQHPNVSFSHPVRLTGMWSGLHDPGPSASSFNYLQHGSDSARVKRSSSAVRSEHMNLRVLFCTPLDDEEAKSVMNRSGSNAHDLSSELLRHALTHRVT